jgi:hypothetical protein
MDRRHRLLTRLGRAWAEFEASYAGLSDEQLLTPGVQGRWSVRDIIAHVTWWEEEALAHLPLVAAGGRPPRYSTRYGGIDAFNAKMTVERQHLSLEEVRAEHHRVHARLLEYVATLPEALLDAGSRVRRRLRLDTYGHYPLHTAAIWRWRQLGSAGQGWRPEGGRPEGRRPEGGPNRAEPG